MLKIETDCLSIGLSVAVAIVSETRISIHAKKGQKSQNYLNCDCCRQNENDIPIKDNIVTEN